LYLNGPLANNKHIAEQVSHMLLHIYHTYPHTTCIFSENFTFMEKVYMSCKEHAYDIKPVCCQKLNEWHSYDRVTHVMTKEFV